MRESITIECFLLSSLDLTDLLTELEEEFWEVRLQRRAGGPPQAGPLGFDEAVVLLAVSIAAKGFLDELTKDVYRGLRGAVLKTIKKAVPMRERRGNGHSFAFFVEREGWPAFFAYNVELDEASLSASLKEIPEILAGLGKEEYACFIFDVQSQQWKRGHQPSDWELQALRRLWAKSPRRGW